MVDVAFLGFLTATISVGASILISVKRPMMARIICIVILAAVIFSIYALLLESNKMKTFSFVIFITMITVVFLSIVGSIISDIKNRGMEHKDIIRHNMNENSTLAKDCVQGLKNDICGLAEECIIAINYERLNEAVQISETMIRILDLLRNHTLTYYLRIALVMVEI